MLLLITYYIIVRVNIRTKRTRIIISKIRCIETYVPIFRNAIIYAVYVKGLKTILDSRRINFIFLTDLHIYCTYRTSVVGRSIFIRIICIACEKVSNIFGFYAYRYTTQDCIL